MNGWNITTMTEMDDLTKKAVYTLSAEPVFPEIGERIKELASELNEKILFGELEYSMQIMPLKAVKDLKTICENEITRRELELKELEDGNEHNEGA